MIKREHRAYTRGYKLCRWKGSTRQKSKEVITYSVHMNGCFSGTIHLNRSREPTWVAIDLYNEWTHGYKRRIDAINYLIEQKFINSL